jgi:hypothetical protein
MIDTIFYIATTFKQKGLTFKNPLGSEVQSRSTQGAEGESKGWMTLTNYFTTNLVIVK